MPAQKQVLTFNELLNDSADGHTAWMMSANKFQHESADGVTRAARGWRQRATFFREPLWLGRKSCLGRFYRRH